MTTAMRTGAVGLSVIRAFETEKLTGYLDAVKIPTIGWGHTEMAGGIIRYTDGTETTRVIVGKTITAGEAERLLVADLQQFERAVLSQLKRSPRQHEFDAMVSLAFNIGPAAFKRSSVLRHFNAGRTQQAADAFLMWNKAGGRVLRGLVRRREAERAVFINDIAEASRHTETVLPGYGAPLENRRKEFPAETGARPDANQGTPPEQSTTIWSQIAAIFTTIGSAAAQAFGAIDWKTAAVITTGAVVAFGIYTISERMRHAKENGI